MLLELDPAAKASPLSNGEDVVLVMTILIFFTFIGSDH